MMYLGSTVHGGGENTTSDRWRKALYISFLVGWLTPEEAVALSIPDDVVASLTDRERRLLGWSSIQAALFAQRPAGAGGGACRVRGGDAGWLAGDASSPLPAAAGQPACAELIRWPGILQPMNPDASSVFSAILPWLVAALVLVFAALAWLVLQMGRLGQRVDSRFAEQHLQFVRELQASSTAGSDRVIDLVAGEVDNLRDRLDAEQATSRHALQQLHLALLGQLGSQKEEMTLRLADLANAFAAGQEKLRTEMLAETLKTLSEHARADRELLQSGLKNASEQLGSSIEAMNRTVGERLEAITGHVNLRLDEGFRKTNETFTSVMARLATIDEAQKKIGDLTTNVVSLQELLGDKRARGAFGEVQLEALVRNALPPESFDFQFTLPNGSRAGQGE